MSHFVVETISLTRILFTILIILQEDTVKRKNFRVIEIASLLMIFHAFFKSRRLIASICDFVVKI